MSLLLRFHINLFVFEFKFLKLDLYSDVHLGCVPISKAKLTALLHFRTPPPPLLLLMTHNENELNELPVALTLTLGGYESAIAPS